MCEVLFSSSCNTASKPGFDLRLHSIIEAHVGYIYIFYAQRKWSLVMNEHKNCGKYCYNIRSNKNIFMVPKISILRNAFSTHGILYYLLEVNITGPFQSRYPQHFHNVDGKSRSPFKYLFISILKLKTNVLFQN